MAWAALFVSEPAWLVEAAWLVEPTWAGALKSGVGWMTRVPGGRGWVRWGGVRRR